MLVYLKADVAKIGRKGSVVEVPDGYARNVLIRRGLARPVTKEEAAHLTLALQEAQKAKSSYLAEVAQQLAQCATQPLVLSAAANAAGRLYTAIREDALRELVERSCNLTLPKECRIHIPTALKHTGEHSIEVEVGKGQRIPFRVHVVPEKNHK